MNTDRQPKPDDIDPLDTLPTMRRDSGSIGIGSHVGPSNRYLITDVLGRGATATVYLAHDEQQQKDIALKVLNLASNDGRADLAGIRSAFESVHHLRHQYMVVPLDLVEMPDAGICLIAMEYVPGRNTLRKERLKRDSLTLKYGEALTFCSKIAEALDRLHEGGFVHRDVKSSNVLLDKDSEPKLSDFGLVASTAFPAHGVNIDAGLRSGTSPYMAPEQWEARRQDGRTDQWALAVMFCELVSGSFPFEAETEEELEVKVLEVRPSRPRHFSDCQWKAVSKALSKEKEDRYPNCTAFIQALSDSANEATTSPQSSDIMTPMLAIFWFVALLALAMSFGLTGGGEGLSSNILPSDGDSGPSLIGEQAFRRVLAVALAGLTVAIVIRLRKKRRHRI